MRLERLVLLALLLAGQAGALAADGPPTGREDFLKAVQSLRAGRFSSARRGLERALAADPSSVEARFYLGQCLYHLGRLDDAKLQLEQAARSEPAMPVTHYYLGRLAYDRRDLGGAFQELRLANSLDPGLPMVHYYLGLVYQAHAQPDAAVLEFERALQLQPDLARAAYDLAWIDFHSLGQRQAARTALQRAAAGKPGPVLAKKIRALKRALGNG